MKKAGESSDGGVRRFDCLWYIPEVPSGGLDDQLVHCLEGKGEERMEGDSQVASLVNWGPADPELAHMYLLIMVGGDRGMDAFTWLVSSMRAGTMSACSLLFLQWLGQRLNEQCAIPPKVSYKFDGNFLDFCFLYLISIWLNVITNIIKFWRHRLICSFHEYFSSACCMPGTIPGSGENKQQAKTKSKQKR